MMGVTQGSYDAWRAQQSLPRQDVARIGADEHRTIFKNEYWNKIKGDALPVGLDYALMDTAINAGPGRATKLLQRTLGLDEDGVMGNDTVMAIGNTNPLEVLGQYTGTRRAWQLALPNAAANPGWATRINSVNKFAADAINNGGFDGGTLTVPVGAQAGKDAFGKGYSVADGIGAVDPGFIGNSGRAIETGDPYGFTETNVSGNVGPGSNNLGTATPIGPAPGPQDFASAGSPGGIGAPNFGAGITPEAPAAPAPGPYDFAGGLASGGDTPNGSLNAGLSPYAPAPGAYDFAGGLAAGGNVPNGDFGAGITPATPAPAPDPYGFGTNVSASIPNGSLGAGVTNLGMGAPPSQQAPTLPPLQAATDVPSLYRNILGREGGAEELAYWNGELSRGNSLGSLQARFIASPEAQTRGITASTPIIQAGSTAPGIPAPTGLTLGPSPSQIATDIPGLYQNILGRTGAPEEVGYWNNQLAAGESLGSITAKFLASPEAQAKGVSGFAPTLQPTTATTVQPQAVPTIGPTTVPTVTDVPSLYRNILGREGGPDEIAYWQGELSRGNSLGSLAARFIASPEAQARGVQANDFAAPSPAPGLSPLVMPQATPTVSAGPTVQASDPIADLYRNILGREGAWNEVGYWTNELRGGKSLDTIRNQFETSPEAQARRGGPEPTPTLAPSYEAPTVGPAAAEVAPAPGLSPLVGADMAQTLGPSFIPTIEAPPTIQATSPGYSPPLSGYDFGQNVSQGVPNGSFGAGLSLAPSIPSYGFSGLNPSGFIGATPQGLGGSYAVGSAVSNLGLDLPGGGGNVDPYSFGGADVSGFDANQGGGSAPSAPAPEASIPLQFGDGAAIQGRGSQLGQAAFFKSEAEKQALMTANNHLFGQQITGVAPGNQTVYDYATGRATGGQAPSIQQTPFTPVNMGGVFAPLPTAVFMPRFSF